MRLAARHTAGHEHHRAARPQPGPSDRFAARRGAAQGVAFHERARAVQDAWPRKAARRRAGGASLDREAVRAGVPPCAYRVTADELRKAGARYARASRRADELRVDRDKLVRAALEAGWTHARIAAVAGMTRGR